jgi:hypothetical protein
MARPSKYESHVKPYFKDIKNAIERGVEEKQIAENLGISQSSWCDYKNKYSEFSELFKNRDVSLILERLDSALLKIAEGYEYQEKKQYIKKDVDGEKVTYTEITTKHHPPNVTAIFGAYNRFDPNYIKDKAYYELKQQELEIKRMNADANNFNLCIEE